MTGGTKDRFERFFHKLYGSSPVGEEGAAALPTSIAETVRALDPRALETVARSTLATAPFLHAIEESQVPRTSLRYVLVHDEIGPAGFLLLTVTDLNLSRLLQGLDGGGSRRRRRLGAAKLLEIESRSNQPESTRIIVGGHPLFRGNHFFEFRDLEPTPSLLATMVRAGYRVRKQEGIGVSLLKDFPPEDLARFAPLENYGYIRFETQPNMVLDIDPRWKSFGGFLASLPGSARKAARERRRLFESRGLLVERARPTPVAAELAELYSQVWQREPGRLATLTPAFFRAVEDHLRDAFRLWVVRKEGRIIAFTAAVQDRLPRKGRNRLLALFTGLDYRLNDDLQLHSNLLYRLVEEAIVEGFEVLDLGRTFPGLKSDLGAQPIPFHCYLRHQNPTQSPLLRALFEGVIRPQEQRVAGGRRRSQ